MKHLYEVNNKCKKKKNNWLSLKRLLKFDECLSDRLVFDDVCPIMYNSCIIVDFIPSRNY